MKKVAIIGAGPAGIYTALFLDNTNLQIDLYEKNNEIGKKLSITGGGRMNLANKNFSAQCFYSHEKNILKNIFKKRYENGVLGLFDKLGTQYIWEEDKAFLASGSAKLEVDRLHKMLEKKERVQIFLNEEVDQIETKDEKFLLKKQIYDYVIITSGGVVSLDGENKKAYKLPLQVGHEITETSPALCPLVSSKNIFYGLEGLSLKCKLSTPEKSWSASGDLIFTHLGISGPAVLDFSLGYESGNIFINFLPNISPEDFRKIIDENRQGKILLKTFLARFFSRRFTLWQMNLIKIPNDKIIANLKKEELKKILKNIFCFEINGFKKADFVSSWTSKGGVKLNKLSYGSLESKLHKNLFFAGEVLDVTGLCGGFNISFAILSAKIISENIN